MNIILSTHMWVSLPNEVRRRIRVVFGIPKSGFTEVSDGVIISDGVTQEDFKSLTINKMKEYLGEESDDFHKLFDKVVAKINDEISGKPPVTVSVVPSKWAVNLDPVVPIVKRGRTSKKNDKKE